VTQVVKAWANKSRVELRSRQSVRSVSPPSMSRLGLRLTPHGHLLLEQADDAPDLEAGSAARLIDAFARGSGSGLVQLGAGEVGRGSDSGLFGLHKARGNRRPVRAGFRLEGCLVREAA